MSERKEAVRDAPCVRCPKCAGSGTVPLPEHLNALLKYLQASGPRETGRIRRDVPQPQGEAVSALNMRLRALEELGLIRRRELNVKPVVWVALPLR